MTLSVVMRALVPAPPLEAMKSSHSARGKEEEASRGQASGGPGLIRALPGQRSARVAMPTGSGWGQGWWRQSPGLSKPGQTVRAPTNFCQPDSKLCFSLGLKVSENQGPPHRVGTIPRMKKRSLWKGRDEKGLWLLHPSPWGPGSSPDKAASLLLPPPCPHRGQAV